MALQVWLPLNGNLNQQGLANVTVSNNGATVNTAGKIGSCYSFSGNSLYGDWSEINTLTQISGCCWVYLNNLSSAQYFFHLGGQSSYPCKFSLDYEGSIRFQINGTEYISGITLTTGIWYHLAITWNGTMAKLYVNGIESYSKSATGSFSASNHFAIGARTNGTAGNTFAYAIANGGKLNDIRLYDHALSPREVKEISKGLVLHYPLNREGFGADNILTNSSGYEGTTNWGGLVTVGEENNQKYLIAKRTDTTSNSRTFCTHTAITSLVSSWSPGDAFTISGYYKVPSTETYEAQGNMFIRWTHSTSGTSYTDTGFSTVAPSGITKDEWIRFENTYTVPANYQNGAVNFYLSAFAKALSTIYWKDVKLEKGSHATPWIPASSDELYSKMGLDENVVYDVSGYKYNGAIINGGISYSGDTPRYQISTEFDGITGAIRVPFNDFVTNGDIFTLNLWWKKKELGSKNYETLFGGPSGFEMDTRSGGASTLSLYMASTRGGNVFSPFNFNQWYMVTLVNDGTNELYYVNGELKKTIEKKAMPTGVYRIGAWASDTGQNYKGLISDFRIYKTALSADDVMELYHTPITLSNNGTLLTQGEYVEV